MRFGAAAKWQRGIVVVARAARSAGAGGLVDFVVGTGEVLGLERVLLSDAKQTNRYMLTQNSHETYNTHIEISLYSLKLIRWDIWYQSACLVR